MGLSKVTINVGRDGLGRRTPNEDKVSGIIFYNDTPPTGWSTENVQLVYTLDEAEQKGLTSTSSGNEAEWYHVSEFFRANPQGELYIGYFDVPAGAYDFTELEELQTKASGRIRQAGIYTQATFAAAHCTTIQGVIDTVDATGGRLVVLLAGDFSAVAEWSAVDVLRALSAEKVSVVIGQDGNAAGKALYDSKSYSITCIGHALGTLSSAPVQRSIGYVNEFNASNGVELEVPALASDDLISTLSTTLLGGLKDKGYLILRKYTPQISGTYYERQPGAIVATDDFAYIEYSRTMDKAVRLAESALTPELNRELYLQEDGTLTKDTVGYFEDLLQAKLDEMEADGEISASEVDVDPTQDVLSTSTLNVTIRIIPVGIAEFITVNIGFTVEL